MPPLKRQFVYEHLDNQLRELERVDNVLAHQLYVLSTFDLATRYSDIDVDAYFEQEFILQAIAAALCSIAGSAPSKSSVDRLLHELNARIRKAEESYENQTA